MDFNQLRGFLAVAQEGSFTKAAEQLFLTQPALSLQIKALEEEFGERLFERRNKQVFLTEAGRILRTRAGQMMALSAQVQQEIAALRGLRAGRIHIGTSDTTCLYVLPPLIRTFRMEYPGIEIHLTNRPSPEVVELLKAGTIDVGIVTLPVRDPHLAVQHLFWREDVAICRPDHPLAGKETVTPADLVQYPLLLLEQGSTSRMLLDETFGNLGAALQTIDLGSIEVVKRYVEIDLGISIVPALAVTEEVRAGRLHAIRLAWLPTRGVGVVQRRQGYLSPAGQVFLDMLRWHIQNTIAIHDPAQPAFPLGAPSS